MNGFARGPVLEQSTQENSLKAYFINVLEYPKLVLHSASCIPRQQHRLLVIALLKIKTAQYRFVS